MDPILSIGRPEADSLRKLVRLTTVLLTLQMPCKAVADEAFQTPEDAIHALVSSVRSGDRKSMLKVLGRGGQDIISSGDEVADAEARQKFLSAYDVKAQMAVESDNRAVLHVGADDFPFPIPLVRKGKGTWAFDTEAGRREILQRRIGRNELAVIQSCLAYVDAQTEYVEKAHDGFYAKKIVSTSGQKDGLYWPSTEGDLSPLGDLVARASTEGYSFEGGRAPFHGYYFKMLTKQGPDAPGGTLDYVVYGKLVGGFGLVAYPAEYRNSGVMTFIVNHRGTVYQKDLGQHTAAIVGKMNSFNPDRSWTKADATVPPK